MPTRKRAFTVRLKQQQRVGVLVQRRARAMLLAVLLVFIAVFMAAFMLRSANAHGDEDHGEQKSQTETGKSVTVAIRTAERNVPTPDGQFKVRLRQSPADPRAGERVQFATDFSEQVEGGFGGGGTLPLEGSKITGRATTAAGKSIATNLAARAEASGSYKVEYAFGDGGEYKIIFDAQTSDNRRFSADFPVSIAAASVNWLFWLGLAALALVSAGAIFGYYNSWQREGMTVKAAARKTLPVAAGALLFFAVGTIALAYFSPPRERRRAIADLPPGGSDPQVGSVAIATGDPALGGSGATIIISKESQLLFGVRTAPVEQRRIVSGLKVTGLVRARPDAQSIVSPPVSGRIFLNRGITIGTAVARGQQLGTIEQILGAPEQATLEGQRIGLRTAALEQQAKQAEQNALAQQARTRLTQARRELQRATNLLAVGAASRKRVEEAQTTVKLAEQEVTAAEQQARVAAQRATLARESVKRVDPVRTFPLLAPVTGIVSELKATTGQQIEAGAELLNIVNLSNVFLEARVFEKDLPIVRDSRRASYTAAALSGEVYKIGEGGDGRLVTVGQAVDPQTRTVPVIYEVPNPLNRLRDGMFVEITVDTTGGVSVLSIPKQAIITEQGRTFAYVFEGGERFEKRAIVLGSEGQGFYEVKSGVQTGERVVTEGIYQLRSTPPGT